MVSVWNIFYHKRWGMWLTFFCLIQQFLCRKRITCGDTPTGFPRYGAASRRLTIVEGYGYVSAQRGLCVLFVNRTAFMRFILLFIFRGTAATDPHQKLKSSPAFSRLRDSKGQSPLVALARAKLRKQQIKIRPHKEKQSQQSKHRTNKSKCIAQSRK